MPTDGVDHILLRGPYRYHPLFFAGQTLIFDRDDLATGYTDSFAANSNGVVKPLGGLAHAASPDGRAVVVSTGGPDALLTIFEAAHLAPTGVPNAGSAPHSRATIRPLAVANPPQTPDAHRDGEYLSAMASNDAAARNYRGVNTQNSLPSGSAMTTQLTSPWPMSIRVAPREIRRSTSAR